MMLLDYCTDDEMSLFLGLFLVGLSAFGGYIMCKVKRPPIFKFKVAFVYLIPLGLSLSFITDSFKLDRDFQILLLCAFMTLHHMLYWREVSKLTTDIGYHKKRLVEFLDIVPDMVWMKDPQNRFTYTNPSIRDILLRCTEEEAYGKTGVELAEIQRKKGFQYTFGEICGDSDEITKEEGMSCRFLEFGEVDGKFLALQVFKAPIYTTDTDGKKKLFGTIGMGRDLTYDYLDHQHISSFLEQGKYKEAKELFRKHMNRYLFTGNKISRSVNGDKNASVSNAAKQQKNTF